MLNYIGPYRPISRYIEFRTDISRCIGDISAISRRCIGDKKNSPPSEYPLAPRPPPVQRPPPSPHRQRRRPCRRRRWRWRGAPRGGDEAPAGERHGRRAHPPPPQQQQPTPRAPEQRIQSAHRRCRHRRISRGARGPRRRQPPIAPSIATSHTPRASPAAALHPRRWRWRKRSAAARRRRRCCGGRCALCSSLRRNGASTAARRRRRRAWRGRRHARAAAGAARRGRPRRGPPPPPLSLGAATLAPPPDPPIPSQSRSLIRHRECHNTTR